METTTEAPQDPQQGPAPWQPPARPPLVRSRTDRKLAGVAGGLGRHLGVDPLLPRIAFVVLAIAGGLGLLLYLIGWALIPEEGEQSALSDSALEHLRQAPPWVPIVLLVVGALIFFGRAWGGPVFWGLALIAAGVWLYRNDTRHTAAPQAAPPPPPVDAPPAATSSWPAYQPPPAPPAPPSMASPSVYYSPPPRPRRPRSPLGRYTLAALLVVLGLAAAADNVGAFHVPARLYPALAMLVVGAGLIVGAFFGRSRMLIVAGLLILPVAFAANLVRVPLNRGAGPRLYTPHSVSDVRPRYDLSAGQLHLDFTSVTWTTTTVTTHARLATGQILVDVPSNVTVEFHGHVGAGDFVIFGQTRSGVDTNFNSVSEGDPAGPRLILNAEVSLGEIKVERLDSSTPLPPLPHAPATP